MLNYVAESFMANQLFYGQVTESSFSGDQLNPINMDLQLHLFKTI